MKLLKHRQPDSENSAVSEKTVQEKEKAGQPMLLPIVFCLISGVLLILLGDLTMKITGYVLAAGMILQGVWLMIGYFRAEPLARIMEAKLSVGLILLVTGSMLAFNPESLRELLPYAWGLALLFGGFLKIQYAFDRKALGSERWWILLILAAFSLVIGVISLLNPAFLGDKKELVIGILLTAEAALDIGVFLLLKRKIRGNAVPAAGTGKTIQGSELLHQEDKEAEEKPEEAVPETET